jgi:uncharacterized repeat protein (TIGR01451 family)
MHSARGFLERWASGPAIVERREDIAEWSHRWVTGARKEWGDVRVVENRLRFGDGSEAFFAMLAAVLVLAAALLLVFPAKALAAPAELSITKEGPSGPSRVEPGERFDYVLTVSNEAGAQPATNVEVKDELPTGATLVESKPPAGVTCTDASGTVTCIVPNLAAGESKAITLTVTAPTTAGEIKNRATATSADDTDSPAASNEVITTVAPELVIDKLDDPDPVDTEDLLLYTLRVQNIGDTDATNVTLTDELPLDAVDFVTVDSADFDCQYKAGIVKCTKGSLVSGEIAKVEIVVEPEKAGTIQNTGAVFVQGVSKALDTDTESTKVNGGGNGGGDNGGGDNNGGGTPDGNDLPEGDQCSPVVERGTEKPIGVLSGTTPQSFIFTNTFNDVLPLRIVYATSSENGSLTITAKPKGGGEPILDKTIQGNKSGVIEVDTDPGVDYEILILPEDQGYAIQFEMGVGPEKCTDPSDLEPPAGPGGNDGTNGGDSGVNGADDVIDDTVSNNPLPPTGGPSLPGLAVIALCLAVLGGATVMGTGVRRRDR